MHLERASVGEDANEIDNAAANPNNNIVCVLNDEQLIMFEKQEALVALRDAVWSVSSAKHGNGVTCLLDRSHDTYWQSDGVVPHIISIDFSRLTPVAAVALYLDYKEDKSYTPRKTRVQAGTHSGDMADIAVVTIDNPEGWVLIKTTSEPEVQGHWEADLEEQGARESELLETNDYSDFRENGVWCTHLRVVLEENLQEGRDCHVRGLRVLGHVRRSSFTTAAFRQSMVLR
ncbi:putative Anaphase promoting complex subunit 10 (APC10) [Trypanosoma vivax]|uniref:Putative anaphase promoting complex, subunit 10-like protein n=1 Tax=Trypanosoma vivax (strain Y486) TaxID=1055687 RepID=G0U4V1_TRYVY|nr:putative anaphase promoting complex, subunit 10-like protein [Trypanosoma vivax]KAH8611603.1 putative Anaphase promoting complex subunit 10 (APC10) [Trypanosoma vivax]CCC52466.1 putative anaphase promoting complex, subunit 10-like protein [Trypanosoma vivax Y486]